MVTISETGHAKNVANLDGVITTAVSMGEAFNPAQPTIQIPAMRALSAKCTAGIINVKALESAFKTALDARELAFKPLNQIVSRIANSLKAFNVTGHVFESVMSYVRKIQGRRSGKSNVQNKTDVQTETKTRSTAQTSFDNKIAHLEGIIQSLLSTPVYTPNEKDLQIESLKALSEDLKKKNAVVASALAELRKARAERNELMYKPVTGLVDIAMDAKMYIKSVFGINSPQFRQVAKLHFTRVRI